MSNDLCLAHPVLSFVAKSPERQARHGVERVMRNRIPVGILGLFALQLSCAGRLASDPWPTPDRRKPTSSAGKSTTPKPETASSATRPSHEAVGQLIAAFDLPNAKEKAAKKLAKVSPMPASATPRLFLALVGHRCPLCRGCHPVLIKRCLDVRMWLVQAIVNVGAPALEPLAKNLRHSDPITRMLAVEVIGHLGRMTPNVPSVIALTYGLSDSDARVRKLAANMIALIAPKQAAVATSLLRTVRDRNLAARCMAVAALIQIGIFERSAGQLQVAADQQRPIDPAVMASARTCPSHTPSFRELDQALQTLNQLDRTAD